MGKSDGSRTTESTERPRYVRPRVQTYTEQQLQTEFAEVFAQSAFSDVYGNLNSP